MSDEHKSAESTPFEKEKKKLDRQYLKQRGMHLFCKSNWEPNKVEYLKQSRKIMENRRDALVKENEELKAKIEALHKPGKSSP